MARLVTDSLWQRLSPAEFSQSASNPLRGPTRRAGNRRAAHPCTDPLHQPQHPPAAILPRRRRLSHARRIFMSQSPMRARSVAFLTLNSAIPYAVRPGSSIWPAARLAVPWLQFSWLQFFGSGLCAVRPLSGRFRKPKLVFYGRQSKRFFACPQCSFLMAALRPHAPEAHERHLKDRAAPARFQDPPPAIMRRPRSPGRCRARRRYSRPVR